MGKVINIRPAGKTPEERVNDGQRFMNELSDDTGADVFAAVMDNVLFEVRIGLGLDEIPDRLEKIINNNGLPAFEAIDRQYKAAAHGCYFCTGDDTDPNGIEFTEKTPLCLTCRLKLRNIMQFLGHTETFGMVEGKIQKARSHG